METYRLHFSVQPEPKARGMLIPVPPRTHWQTPGRLDPALGTAQRVLDTLGRQNALWIPGPPTEPQRFELDVTLAREPQTPNLDPFGPVCHPLVQPDEAVQTVLQAPVFARGRNDQDRLEAAVALLAEKFNYQHAAHSANPPP